MGSAISTFDRTLVEEEIKRIVADASADSALLSAPAAAAQIARTHPNSGLTDRAIADRLMMAAAEAGIASNWVPRSMKL